MRNWTLAAAAVATVLAVAAPARYAAAMPVPTPGQLGLAAGGGLEKTVLVCGPWGCYWRPGYWGGYRPYPYGYPYWGWRRHYWWGWHRPWGWRRW